uniref:Non-structural protein NS7c n=1 Tax=Hipposideros bat coronavirus HKU10 TaxID=1241932 RepID=K4JZ54_9ALPC|nr:non-structural protein NS7c [Hipposideros bat coronavirus HKU10]AFU92084.1 non-structural protein NS7c [Hipposideros bat coronavirus HKU10]AFU92093.1 non-structural protein NS7c [Hipposideros bat coronavirus HKU10]
MVGGLKQPNRQDQQPLLFQHFHTSLEVKNQVLVLTLIMAVLSMRVSCVLHLSMSLMTLQKLLLNWLKHSVDIILLL